MVSGYNHFQTLRANTPKQQINNHQKIQSIEFTMPSKAKYTDKKTLRTTSAFPDSVADGGCRKQMCVLSTYARRRLPRSNPLPPPTPGFSAWPPIAVEGGGGGGGGAVGWAPAFNVPDIIVVIKFCIFGSCMSWVAMFIRAGFPKSCEISGTLPPIPIPPRPGNPPPVPAPDPVTDSSPGGTPLAA